MDSCAGRGAGRARMASLVALSVGVLLAWPAGAWGVTITVGRQDLSTTPTTNFGCTATTDDCWETVLPSGLTAPGDLAVVPRDGKVTSWRVVGSATEAFGALRLRVLRRSGSQYAFVGTAPSVTGSLDGTPTPINALPVAAGDLLAIEATASYMGGGVAEVDAVDAPGATYVLFSPFLVSDGATVSPTSAGQDVEPLYNADVVLDRPVVSGVTPASAPTTGGQTVTINGNHLTGASQVEFGSVPATSFTVVSNRTVSAVTPPSAAGAVDVIVTTLGGTSSASAGDRFTFVSDAGAPAAASFVGTRSSITVSRERRFRFGFHAAVGLTGTAVFKSVKRVQTSSTRRVTLARKSFTVPAGGKVTLRIKLSRKKFRILKLNHKIRVRVTVTLKDAAGLTSTASKNITLKAPRRG